MRTFPQFVLHQREVVFIPKSTAEQIEQIQEPAHAEDSQSQSIEDAGADLAHIKPVDTQPAKENAQHIGCGLILKGIGLFFPGEPQPPAVSGSSHIPGSNRNRRGFPSRN